MPATPDFIIGGAPKCGTTSLHLLLDAHPDVWVARNEVYFHDADDPIAHGDFLRLDGRDLSWRDPSDPAFAAWYAERFRGAPDDALIGEDTTTYLMSDVAPHRIAANGHVRVIFMLRDPVQRAFSQYWHLLRSGRTHLPLEEALSAERSILLGSTYAPHLSRFFDLLGPERVHVVLFEDFQTRQQAVMDGVTGFLGLPPMDVGGMGTWHNRTLYPKRAETLQRLNRLGRPLARYRYARHFGGAAPWIARAGHSAYRRWYRFVRRRILTEERPPAEMRAKTQAFLRQHLSARNAGLSALLSRDLSTVWPGFSQ
ncbi:MAG: sulfotransferase [Pseudomonadota bacterium]